MSTTIAEATFREGARPRLGTAALSSLALLGRVFYSAIFIMSGPNHFKAETIGYAAAQGVPLASIAVPLSGIIALLGGLSIALGYRAKLGAWLIVLFLIPVTLMLHRFWGLSDPQAAGLQLAMFMKNLSLLGAALIIARLGSGPLSIKRD
jgi:putative oxidoreductase